MATLEETHHSISLVQELLRSCENFEDFPPALRRRVSKVLRDYPSTEAVTRALEPLEPNITYQSMCVLIDARALLEYIAGYFCGPLDRGLIRFALRSYPGTPDLIKAAAKKKSPRSTLETQAC